MLNIGSGEFPQIEDTFITYTQIKKQNVSNSLDPALPLPVITAHRVTTVLSLNSVYLESYSMYPLVFDVFLPTLCL